jgi:hypothetical protein
MDILQSKKFKIIMGVIGGFIILLFAFGIGTFVGMRRANFSMRWAENYQRNFGGPRFNDHGISGQVIKIDTTIATSTPSLIIIGRDNTEKIVLIKNDTIINGPQNNLKLADLKINDYIVVIGDPNDAGQIEARLIRLMPVPMMPR